MAAVGERETIFNSKIKSKGIFSFKDFYKFCFDWLSDETGLDVAEDKYKEKLTGNEKYIEIEWTGTDKVTDYFKFEVKVAFQLENLVEVEIQQPGGAKIKSNKGSVEITVKGNLIRDYEGKFDTGWFSKFWRGIYDKWVIPSRIKQFEDKLAEACSEFLEQAKAYLDLEGKK